MIKKLTLARRFIAAGMLSGFIFIGIASVNAQNISDETGGELVYGLIAYWPFDNAAEIEDSQVVVDLIGGVEGEVNGNGIVAGEGVLGGAIDFAEDATDGSVTIEYVNDWLAAASDADQLSVSLWQKLHAVRPSSTFWFSAESAGGGMRNYQAHIPWGNSNIYFDTAGCCGGGDTRINKGWGGDYHTWNHFAFIKNEDLKQIFINGELFHEGENTNPLPMDFDQLHIMSQHSGDYRTPGLMDDFAIFASALEAEQLVEGNGGFKRERDVRIGEVAFLALHDDDDLAGILRLGFEDYLRHKTADWCSGNVEQFLLGRDPAAPAYRVVGTRGDPQIE